MVNEKLTLMLRPSVPEHVGAAALVITTDESDRPFMAAALETLARRAARSFPRVIMHGDAQAPSWRKSLDQVSGAEASPGPKSIVASRLADDRPWAEVLNLGGYDLRPKPLDVDQVTWVVRSALSERNATHRPVRPAEAREKHAWNGC